LTESAGTFDVILSNHVFYYVPDLQRQLARLVASLSASGVLVTAVAARSNALIGIWIAGFRLLGQDIPYHTSEDVESALRSLGTNYSKREVAYLFNQYSDGSQIRIRTTSDHYLVRAQSDPKSRVTT
jgi:trans-aconitate 2-methyltransferase